MAFQFSTGFKDNLLDTESLKSIFDDGFITIYAGTIPASPDDGIGAAVAIVEYTDANQVAGVGTGLDLEAAAVGGAISKAAAQVWEGTAGATDTATFFRFYQLADAQSGASTTAPRIQGTVGGGGADLFVASTSFTSAVDYTLDMFSLSIPSL